MNMKTFNNITVVDADGEALVAAYFSLLAELRARTSLPLVPGNAGVAINEIRLAAVISRATTYTNNLNNCFRSLSGLGLDSTHIHFTNIGGGRHSVELFDLDVSDLVDVLSIMLAALAMDTDTRMYRLPRELNRWFHDVIAVSGSDRAVVLEAYAKLFQIWHNLPSGIRASTQHFGHVNPVLAGAEGVFNSTGVVVRKLLLTPADDVITGVPHIENVRFDFADMSQTQIHQVYTDLFQAVHDAARKQVFWVSAASLASELGVPLPETFVVGLATTAT